MASNEVLLKNKGIKRLISPQRCLVSLLGDEKNPEMREFETLSKGVMDMSPNVIFTEKEEILLRQLQNGPDFKSPV
jgi:hypothetical protein